MASARIAILALAGLAAITPAGDARPWGAEGHRITALIAQSYLKPRARAALDALLAADADPLTAPDLASRAVWADLYRNTHRETASWHFADIETDGSNSLEAACAQSDCLVDRLEAFEGVLADARRPTEERIMALKFVLHLDGDLHQPLHLSDNHDRGGNCLHLAGAGGEPLHRYWDVDVVEAQGRDAATAASALAAAISREEAARWRKGGPRDWALETFKVGASVAYWPAASSPCGSATPPLSPPPGYAETAAQTAAAQLKRAGVRLAELLNRALAP